MTSSMVTGLLEKFLVDDDGEVTLPLVAGTGTGSTQCSKGCTDTPAPRSHRHECAGSALQHPHDAGQARPRPHQA